MRTLLLALALLTPAVSQAGPDYREAVADAPWYQWPSAAVAAEAGRGWCAQQKRRVCTFAVVRSGDLYLVRPVAGKRHTIMPRGTVRVVELRNRQHLSMYTWR